MGARPPVPRLSYRVLLAWLLVLAGCAGSTAPTVPLVVGAWCTQANTASVQGTTWTVTLYTNTTTHQFVTDSQGIVHDQEVRGCASTTCVIANAPANWTATDAITYCQQHG